MQGLCCELRLKSTRLVWYALQPRVGMPVRVRPGAPQVVPRSRVSSRLFMFTGTHPGEGLPRQQGVRTPENPSSRPAWGSSLFNQPACAFETRLVCSALQPRGLMPAWIWPVWIRPVWIRPGAYQVPRSRLLTLGLPRHRHLRTRPWG